jgi:long-subunit acyl-CoA synthetase (AMP-forming)/acyl carrier protein
MKRELKQVIRYNRDALTASDRSLKAIYQIMFRNGENVLCESNDGFRIRKSTYAQMHRRIEETAAALCARLESTGHYIGLAMDNCEDWIVAFWAILRSGNKPYLVNLRYPDSLTNNILHTLDIHYVISQMPTSLAVEAILMSQLAGEHPAVPEDVFADEIAFSSSATSMNEVICFYTGAQIAAQILNFEAIVKESPRIAKHYRGSLKQLAFLPFYHVFGLFAVYFWFTFFGRTLVFLRDYSAETILSTVRRHQVTHIFAVPMLWHTVEKKIFSAAKDQGEKQEAKLRKGLSLMTRLQNICPRLGSTVAKRMLRQVTDKLFGRSVMFCISGGSYLRPSAMTLLNGLGYWMHNGYGMSEIGITSVELRSRPKYRNLNSIGHPFSGVEYRLDERGVLHVRGSSLCVRKLVNGQETALGDWFATGDLMDCRDGHYYIHGRLSDVVIGENGENINPDTVEQLFTLDAARQLCVLGLGEQDTQVLSLVVQVSPYASAQTLQSLRDTAYAINDALPTAMAVRRFYVTADDLAPPQAVKVSRAQLAKKIAGGQVHLQPLSQAAAAARSQAGESALEQQVRKIVADVLELDITAVQPDSHIIHDLGASSIQYFSIVAALAEQFSLSDYDKTEAYRYTPREISQYIERFL